MACFQLCVKIRSFSGTSVIEMLYYFLSKWSVKLETAVRSEYIKLDSLSKKSANDVQT